MANGGRISHNDNFSGEDRKTKSIRELSVGGIMMSRLCNNLG